MIVRVVTILLTGRRNPAREVHGDVRRLERARIASFGI